MSSKLYIYAGPPGVEVFLQLDSGISIMGEACSANGRDDAFRFALPVDTPPQGSVLTQSYGGATKTVRGLTIPQLNGVAAFQFDDFGTLEAAPIAPPVVPVPPEPPTRDPSQIVEWVYSSEAYGDFNLATKEGCGLFVEACVTCLHTYVSASYGHILKTGGQNQYNGHAVDALMNLAGEGAGIWDIIHDSESPNASPAYNYKGEPDYNLWVYPANAAGRTTRRTTLII